MKIVFETTNPFDARLVMDALEHHDIPAMLLGGQLVGVLGEVPDADRVRLGVADGLEVEALRIIAAWRAERLDESSETGAIAKSTFGAGEDGLPMKSAGWGKAVLAGVVGAAIGWVVAYAQLRLPFETDQLDWDQDGRIDSVVHYSGDLPIRVEDDRNGDGKADFITVNPYYGSSTILGDDNFDGRFESRGKYERNLFAGLEVDRDGDGFFELRDGYHNGVITELRYLSPTDGTLRKRVQYKDGWIEFEDVDTDADGRLDTRRHYDPLDEVIREELIAPAPATE